MKRASLLVLAPSEVPIWQKAVRWVTWKEHFLGMKLPKQQFDIQCRKIYKELKNAK